MNPDDEKFRRALAHINEAQSHANAAAADLCSVNQVAIGEGNSTAYSIACRLGDRIKADWHRINEQRPTVRYQ